MADVTGSEFEMLVELLSELAYVSTPEGSKELCGLISDQAELTSEFKVNNQVVSLHRTNNEVILLDS